MKSKFLLWKITINDWTEIKFSFEKKFLNFENVGVGLMGNGGCQCLLTAWHPTNLNLITTYLHAILLLIWIIIKSSYSASLIG